MKFKGLQGLSLIDYPNKLCATLFTGGCNFRCPYCHNPELVIGYEKLPDIIQDEILKFLKERKGFLDGITICGGEPTIHSYLPDFVKLVKKEGFLVKLDTNGTNPDMLKKIEVDYIAMDIKGSLKRYNEVSGVKVDTDFIKKSVDLIMESSIDYEFRTTVFPDFFNKEDAVQIAKWVKGAKRYVLQKPTVVKTLDGNIKNAKLYSDAELRELADILPNCSIR